jgi:HK97 family phage portal protein
MSAFTEWWRKTFGREEKAWADAVWTTSSTWDQTDKPIYSPVSFESMVVHGYRRNELIFACISKTANTASQISLKFYDNEGDEIENHPAKTLIQRPNPFMSEFDFWSSVIIYQKLAGCAYYEKVRSRAGKVVQLWPLRPDWVAPVPNRQRVIGSYRYGPSEQDSVPLRTEDVLAFTLWDPMGLFSSWPPVAVAARSGDVDNNVTDYLKMFMERGGTPPGLIKTVQRLKDTEIERIRQQWGKRYGGVEHWLEPAVLDADASYQQIGQSVKDMGFDMLDERDEVRICMVLDVPPIIVGSRIGLMRSTYANYSEARSAWWEDSLLPMYANFEDTIINSLMPEFAIPGTPAWDVSRITALQEDQNSRWSRATTAATAGLITINEFRVEVGLQEEEGQDIYLRPASVVAVEADMSIDVGNEIEDEITDEDEQAETEAETETASHNSGFEHKNAPDDDERRLHEKELSEKMTAYFEQQKSDLLRELANAG